MSNEFSDEDLVTIRKALLAYSDHLTPSASHVKSIADWRDKVWEMQEKVSKILLNSRRMM